MRSFVSLRPGSRFRTIYSTGRRNRSGGITAFVSSSVESFPEVGIVTGKRVGNAVQRNRAKRRIREAVHSLDLPASTAVVFVASARTVDVEYSILVQWVAEAVGAISRTPASSAT